MSGIYYCKISRNGDGLCNQLFSLVTGIIVAIKMHKKIIIVDKFLNDYTKQNYSYISEILNIDKMNDFLYNKYGIYICDRRKSNITIHKITYGTHDTEVDITDSILDTYYSENRLYVPIDLNLNILAKEDPCPFHKKYVFVKYSIHNHEINDTFEEEYCFLKTPIYIDMSPTLEYIHTFGWIDAIDKTMFDDVLRNIVFVDLFSTLSDIFMQNKEINPDNKINVLHLRLEQDAIDHWSKMNSMDPIIFKHIIEQTYIKLIKRYVNKDEMNVILSYSTQNSVIDFLKDNQYLYCFTDKLDIGREVNAAIDLNIGCNLCNNLFIGNFNLFHLNGSSLSYYLINKYREKSNVKMALIDLDHILNVEQKCHF